MHFSHAVAVALIIPALSACTIYGDPKGAETAQKADHDAIRAGFKPRSTPLAKSGRVVIPSKALLMDRRGVAPDYVYIGLYNDYRVLAEMIRQRNIFERLDIEESAEAGHAIPKVGEALIYLYMPDNRTRGWYYISETTKRTPLHLDQGTPDKVGKVKYFIDSVEALAAREPK